MYEFTHKGAWFKWSALNRADKKLVVISLAASLPAALVLGLPLGEYAFQLGYWIGSGGRMPSASFYDHLVSDHPSFVSLYPLFIIAALVLAVVSGIAWWRFSQRQDELFNRVQNYAIGLGCAWGVAAASTWWGLAEARLLLPLPFGGVLIAIILLICFFWFRAVRKWA